MAKPPVITAINSDVVIVLIYGRIKIGASVCPTNMFAEILSVSAPLVFMLFSINNAIHFTKICIIPKWYAIEMRLEKITTGNALNAKLIIAS